MEHQQSSLKWSQKRNLAHASTAARSATLLPRHETSLAALVSQLTGRTRSETATLQGCSDLQNAKGWPVGSRRLQSCACCQLVLPIAMAKCTRYTYCSCCHLHWHQDWLRDAREVFVAHSSCAIMIRIQLVAHVAHQCCNKMICKLHYYCCPL